MADGLFFNWAGRTYRLELFLFDEPSVWRAWIDGKHEVFFEASPDCDIVELIDFAVEAWLREFNPGG